MRESRLAEGLEDRRGALRSVIAAAVLAADPARAVAGALRAVPGGLEVCGERVLLPPGGRLLLAAAGKAAVTMAAACQRILGDRIDAGLIIVKRGCESSAATRGVDSGTGRAELVEAPGRGGSSLRSPSPELGDESWRTEATRTSPGGGRRLDLMTAGHPIPDDSSLAATEKLLALARSAGPRDTMLFLLSGGASALLAAPAEGLRLEDEAAATRLLLECGASIVEINCVRKHLSEVKGGRLALAAGCGRLVTLAISDVVGSDPSSIGSGPTVADPSTHAAALAIVDRHALRGCFPRRALAHLERGAGDPSLETPKPGDPCFERTSWHLLADHGTSLRGACERARELGFEVRELGSSLTGEARELGLLLGRRLEELTAERKGEPRRPILLAGTGETVVTVRGAGKGGRCTELTLAAALALEEGRSDRLVAGFATDGSDGTTGAAGAFADGTTRERARAFGMDPDEFLHRNDSFTLFERLGDLIRTGGTGTNVGDLYLAALF